MQINARRLSDVGEIILAEHTEGVQLASDVWACLCFYTKGFFFFWFLWHPSVQASGSCSRHFEVVTLTL